MKGLYFEIGTIIFSDNNKVADIEKTMSSVLAQDKTSAKICVVSANRTGPIPQNWIRKTTEKCKKLGVQNFTFLDIVTEYDSSKDLIFHAFKNFIEKPMPIVVHTEEGDKKSKISLSHFSIIPAGYIYKKDTYNSTIKNRYIGGERSLVYYGNFYDGKKKYTTPFCDLSIDDDVYPKTMFLNGFKFFIKSKSSESIIKQYEKIHNEREEKIGKGEDTALNDVIFTHVKDLSICY